MRVRVRSVFLTLLALMVVIGLGFITSVGWEIVLDAGTTGTARYDQVRSVRAKFNN